MTSPGLHVTVPILVSFFTSVIVSVAGFFISARIAKERADRGSLRDIYKAIFAHFHEMKDAIEKGVPKTWGNYTNGRPAGPLIYRYGKDGTLSQLPRRISETCQDVERDTINAAGKFGDDLRKNFGPKVVAWAREALNPPGEIAEMGTLVMVPLGQILLEERSIEEAFGYLEKQGIGIHINMYLEGSGATTIPLFRARLPDGDVIHALTDIKRLASKDSKTRPLCDDLRIQKRRLKELLAMLSSRINDPHPIKETIWGSVRDLFHP